jgi:hypothetical protein
LGGQSGRIPGDHRWRAGRPLRCRQLPVRAAERGTTGLHRADPRAKCGSIEVRRLLDRSPSERGTCTAPSPAHDSGPSPTSVRNLGMAAVSSSTMVHRWRRGLGRDSSLAPLPGQAARYAAVSGHAAQITRIARCSRTASRASWHRSWASRLGIGLVQAGCSCFAALADQQRSGGGPVAYRRRQRSSSEFSHWRDPGTDGPA